MSDTLLKYSNLPSLRAMEAFLQRVLPGQSVRTQRLRRELIEFAASPSAKALLLTGPIGSGKSTVARIAAMLKRVAHLKEDEATALLAGVKTQRANQIDVNYMSSWYVELPLTGLVETLADAQLFGSVKGAYTGAIDRPGIFELASYGRMTRDDPAIGALVTGGVVFLDEIGDLTEALQAKLLPVLSGGTFYRIGQEGKRDADLSFEGVVISASWRSLDGQYFRPDLLSRIAGTTIEVPGLSDRLDDFDNILDAVVVGVIETLRKNVAKIEKDPNAAKEWLNNLLQNNRITDEARGTLSKIEWARFGNLRGLTAAVERLVSVGITADQIAEELAPRKIDDSSSTSTTLLQRLLSRSPNGRGLAANVRAIEVEERRKLREILAASAKARTSLASSLRISETQLRDQLRQLDRQRLGGGDD